MRVLVTGGAGFVGAHVIRDLVARGDEVVAYDVVASSPVLDATVPGWREHPDITLVRGAITGAWKLLHTCRTHQVDTIVHLASPLTTGVNEDLRTGLEDICSGTANVFEVARALGIRRTVWTSSISVFGAPEAYGDVPIDDESPVRPASFYGACKALCEQMGTAYRDRYDVDSIALRLTIVYGPGRASGATSFVSAAAQAAAERRPVHIGYGDQRLNWQYVDDVAAMVLAALDAPRPSRTVFTTSGDVRTIREAGQLLREIVPDVEVVIADGRFDGVDGLTDFPVLFDDRGLRDELGFTWRCDLRQGLERTVAAAQRPAALLDALPDPERTR